MNTTNITTMSTPKIMNITAHHSSPDDAIPHTPDPQLPDAQSELVEHNILLQ
jgi:hypothetical protein